MNGIVVPWLAEVVLITARTITKQKRPPLPSEFLASFIVFGAVGLVAESDQLRQPATLFGWGIVIATALNLFGTGDRLISPWNGTSPSDVANINPNLHPSPTGGGGGGHTNQ